MSIKQIVLFGVIGVVATAITALIVTSLPVAKDTKPAVTLEQLDNKLKTVQSDNKSGLFQLEQKQKELSTLQSERATLEEKLQ